MNKNHNLIITGSDNADSNDVFHVETQGKILFTGNLQNCMDYIDTLLSQ